MITEIYSKTRWKRSVFTLDLKSVSLLDSRISDGEEFQSVGTYIYISKKP